jgi:hypothetical protein
MENQQQKRRIKRTIKNTGKTEIGNSYQPHGRKEY